MNIFSGTISNLENAMSRANVKQKVISNNIANIDTPNYKSKNVTFRDMLSEANTTLSAKKTYQGHIEFSKTGSNYSVVSSNRTSYQENGNNVDIDQEMSELAKNQIQYNALVERMSSKFNSLKTVLTGGK
ncbi:flagellar basal body rod protein FlgB [Bacillus sp. 179-C3.3 HS]|uniref:flagellar basal body rod protein FlgB n=1 Tax=Bacillus sp. 179-C3.3 HS TaxID=3232162 RepID=UPI0039A1ABD1